METYSYNSKIGWLTLEGNDSFLSKVSFLKTSSTSTPRSMVLKETQKQLDQYFSGDRMHFELPLQPKGTDFQKSVWKELMLIPFGKVSTYGELAQSINNPKASRAVGMANNKNPLPIIIPCHRVIGKNGSLTGYAGGLEIKKHLLMIENHQI
jgi:methylated-DNA-[protein]-cysteine S-methyltransferase